MSELSSDHYSVAQAPPNGRMNVLPLLKIYRSSEVIELKVRNTATLFGLKLLKILYLVFKKLLLNNST